MGGFYDLRSLLGLENETIFYFLDPNIGTIFHFLGAKNEIIFDLRP